ncbi:hypothetical protein T484DRAFT_2131963 [Baffinella frigidus]|nr:hypothetical protein T484DRAFT_2131963 [Cryptophyta sp. CCMP2293]
MGDQMAKKGGGALLVRQHSSKQHGEDESPPGSPTRHKHGAAYAVPDVVQGPPLDYSFLEIQTIEELREVLPRSGFRKQPPEFVVDEAGLQIPNPIRDEWVKPGKEFETNAIKLGNNMLAALPPAFNVIIREVMERPRQLSWIDLSFNHLEEVPQILALYSNLSVVYLHANRIRKVREIETE